MDQIVNKVADAFKNMREEADLPDSSASDDFVAEEFIKYLGRQNLYVIEDSGLHEVTFSAPPLKRWGLKHPPACRPDLIGCSFNEYLSERSELPDIMPGTYFMELVMASDGWSVPQYTLKEEK